MTKTLVKLAAWALVAPALLLAGNLGAAAESPVFDVPRLKGIVVDGKDDDWGTAGFKVAVMTSVDGWVRSAADMDCRFALGWDERGLLVLLRVSDQDCVEVNKIEELYGGDSVELYLADKRGGKQMIQAVIAPGLTREQPELRQRVIDYRTDATLKATPPAVQAARSKVAGGYVLEVLLPWANIGVTPEVGREVALQLYANDRDRGEQLFNTVWYPATGTFQDSNRAYRIRLAKRPGPSFASVARGFGRQDDAWFSVIAAPELAGQAVAVRFNGHEIAAGELAGYDGRALACLSARRPEGVDENARFEVVVAGQGTNIVGLLDLENERGERRLPLRFVFRPFVFADEALPAGRFEDPLAMERLLGPHEIKVSFYDAAFHPVTNAPQPGRYGAVVEVVPRFHPPLRRYYTLFRTDKPIEWPRADIGLEVTLPKELGVNPMVVREQTEAVNEFLRPTVAETLAQREDGAMLLAWLRETPPAARATQRNGPQLTYARWMYELKRRTGMLAPLKYWVEVPASAAKDPARKWPTIFYLHGSGDRGEPVASLARTAAVRFPRELKPDTFIVIAPRCPVESWWSLPALEDLLKEILAKYPVDADRLYLTGASMGGYASWELLTERPELFAAAVPICGRGTPGAAVHFKDIPVWVFHGAKDEAVPVARSREMVAALRQLGGRVRYTEYPDQGHTIWNTVYNTPELYDWLLEQVRGQPAQPPATTDAAQ